MKSKLFAIIFISSFSTMLTSAAYATVSNKTVCYSQGQGTNNWYWSCFTDVVSHGTCVGVSSRDLSNCSTLIHNGMPVNYDGVAARLVMSSALSSAQWWYYDDGEWVDAQFDEEWPMGGGAVCYQGKQDENIYNDNSSGPQLMLGAHFGMGSIWIYQFGFDSWVPIV